jgi:hypothetical protein
MQVMAAKVCRKFTSGSKPALRGAFSEFALYNVERIHLNTVKFEEL